MPPQATTHRRRFHRSLRRAWRRNGIGSCLAVYLACHTLHAAEPLTTIPLIGRAPVIDGAIDAKEWGVATVLQPLPRASDDISEQFATRISLAWSPDTLFIVLQHSRPALAPITDDPKAKDQLTITLTGPSGRKLTLHAWAGAARLEPDDKNAAPAWQQAGDADTRGWTVEVALPLNRLASRKELLDSGARLAIELNEPSLGEGPHRLVHQIRFAQRRFAFRFLDACEFDNGSHQGVMAELVNADGEPVSVSVAMSVSPANGSPVAFTTEKLDLSGDSRRRIRLALPLTRGRFTTGYSLALNGSPFASGHFAFDGNGPLRVQVIPFFLWRGGVFVKSNLLNDTNAVTYRCTLRAPSSDKPLAAAETQAKGSEAPEQFIDTSRLRPGPYLLTVTATRDGSELAERTLTFIQPEYPKWWRQRR